MLSSCSEGYLVLFGVFCDSGVNTCQNQTGSWELQYMAPKGDFYLLTYNAKTQFFKRIVDNVS